MNNKEIIKLIADVAVTKTSKWFSGEAVDLQTKTAEGCFDIVDNDLDKFFLGEYDPNRYGKFLKENRFEIVTEIVEQLKMVAA